MEEQNKILIYSDNDGLTRIDVVLEDETLWLTQAQMCELYQTSKSNVSEHIKHIFEDGKMYMTNFYNLDMIIALGLPSKKHYRYSFQTMGHSALEGIY